MSKKLVSRLALIPAFVAAGSANAALDTEVTTAITTAQTDLIALYGALTAAGVVVWVARLIYRHFKVR